MNGRHVEPSVPLEQFITALTSQLDRAQNAMAIKAKLGYPLTFAVKDLKLELRAHVEMQGSVVTLRSAGADDREASTLHLELTTITRPMMEENTHVPDPQDVSLDQALGDTLNEDERRRLEWAGVRTVSQLLKLEQSAQPEVIEKISNVPALRLKAALQRASRPRVQQVVFDREPAARQPEPDARPGASIAPAPDVPTGSVTSLTPQLRIKGLNLMREVTPKVTIDRDPVPVLRASPGELLLAPKPHQLRGLLAVETAPGLSVQLQLPADGDAAPVTSFSAWSIDPDEIAEAGADAAEATGRAEVDGVDVVVGNGTDPYALDADAEAGRPPAGPMEEGA